MPTLLAIEALEADRAYAQRQLTETKPSQWGTARLMWQSRLADIEKQLEELGTVRSNYASVALIFDGMPVIGTTDIRLDFTTAILDSYQKVVSLSLASSLNSDLPQRGPLPGIERSRLFITDLARGSMGFVLEEVAPEQSDMLPSALKNAVEEVTHQLEVFNNSADDEFYEIIEDIQPRLIAAISKFTQILFDAKASTRIIGNDHRIALTLDDISRLSSRLNEIEIIEEIETADGTLLGILPEARQFELKLPGGDAQTVKGAISDDLAVKYIADANFKERLLLQPVRAQIKRIQTTRNGRLIREQYLLEAVEALES